MDICVPVEVMNLRMVHSLELIFRHIGGLEMRLWQCRSLRQFCLKVGEELGDSVRKLTLKSHVEEMDYEREIYT